MLTTLMLGLALTVSTDGKDGPKKPLAVVGDWTAVKMTAGGVEAPAPPGGLVFSFKADGKLLLKDKGKGKDEEGSYKVDETKTPAEIEIIPPADKKDQSIEGIVKVDGDTLTICFTPGGKRPTKFESPKDSMVMMFTLKKVTK